MLNDRLIGIRTHFTNWILLIWLMYLFIIPGTTTQGYGGYDDYYGGGGGMDPYGRGGEDPYSYGYDGASDPEPTPSEYDDTGNDINAPPEDYNDEVETKTKKKFKLFEKRKYNYEKAKAFCKKREGKLAQAADVDEMQRLQTLLMKGTKLTTSVWIGADKREWKHHASKMLGRRPNLPPGAMMMGGGRTAMCPGLSLSSRSMTPVECFKEFAFICEFAPGGGLSPKQKKAKLRSEQKKKDEMRRKRETSYNFQSSTALPNIESEEHKIEENAVQKVIVSEQSTQGFEETGDVNYDDASSKTNEDSIEKIAEAETDSTEKASESETIHPDQQMLNLFDEQLKNMELPSSGEVDAHSQLNESDTIKIAENPDKIMFKDLPLASQSLSTTESVTASDMFSSTDSSTVVDDETLNFESEESLKSNEPSFLSDPKDIKKDNAQIESITASTVSEQENELEYQSTSFSLTMDYFNSVTPLNRLVRNKTHELMRFADSSTLKMPLYNRFGA